METFDFPFHRVEGENPETGFVVELGNSYTFATPPTDPDQRVFTLHFTTMKYYTNSEGIVDATIDPNLNMLRLLNFYYEHKLWKDFIYNHPVHGALEVRFKKPCPEPDGIPGGFGAVKEFEIVLVEQP